MYTTTWQHALLMLALMMLSVVFMDHFDVYMIFYVLFLRWIYCSCLYISLNLSAFALGNRKQNFYLYIGIIPVLLVY